MRKATIIHYDDVDVRKIVRDELDKAKPDWVQEITDSVTKSLSEKFNKVMTVLDKFVGEIQTYRDEQTLHQGQHDKIKESFKGYDLRLNKLEHPSP